MWGFSPKTCLLSSIFPALCCGMSRSEIRHVTSTWRGLTDSSEKSSLVMKCQKKQTLLHRSQRYSLWGHLIYCLQSRYRAPNFQSPLYPKNWRNFPCSAQSCVIFQKQWSCFQHFVPMQTQQRTQAPGEPLHAGQDTGHRGWDRDPEEGRLPLHVSAQPLELLKASTWPLQKAAQDGVPLLHCEGQRCPDGQEFSSLPGPAPGCLHLPIIKWSKAINHHLRGKSPATTASQFSGTFHSAVTACSHRGTFCSLSFCFPTAFDGSPVPADDIFEAVTGWFIFFVCLAFFFFPLHSLKPLRGSP